VVVGLGADEALGDDPRPGPQALGAGDVGVHEHDGRRAVRDLGRRARGVHAVVQHRLEGGEPFAGGLAETLVAGHGAVRGRDGHDLAVEPALLPGGGREGLGADAEVVEVLPREAAADGDALGGRVLVRQVDVPVVGARLARVAHVRPQRHPAHRLDAAGDARADHAGVDEARDEVGGLLRRAALAVDRRAPGAVGEPGVQPGRTGDVERLLAGLGDAAPDHLLDPGRVETGALDHSALRGAQQFHGVQGRQDAAAAPDRGPHGLDDHRLTHVASPLSVGAVEQTRTRSSYPGNAPRP
jgi:hypothetical protein